MAEAKTDMLAKFEGKEIFQAECQLEISPNDALALDKTPVMSDGLKISGGRFAAGYFSQVDAFNFDIQLVDRESPEHKARVQKSVNEDAFGETEIKTTVPGQELPKGFDPRAQEFAQWRDRTDSDSTAEKEVLNSFSIKAGEFSLSRRIDSASPKLLEYCCTKYALYSVSILKRTMVPAGAGGKMDAMTYLRIDFTDVLVIGVDWSDGDMLEEKYKFQASTIVIRLMSQESSGRLRPCKTLTWKAKVNDKALAARLG
jgi:type VI protein secretion system component Hcp